MPVRRKLTKRTKKVKPKEIRISNKKTVKTPDLAKFYPLHDVQEKASANLKIKKLPLWKKNYTKNGTGTYKSSLHTSGLSPKEKSYIISNLQNKTSRYSKLKDLADKAKREGTIFSIYGSCNAVRKALLQRGWVEKIPPNRMNLAKIHSGSNSSKSDIHNELERLMLSNLLEKCDPNFVWRETHHDYVTTIDMKKECRTIVNKLKADALWTTKQGLCMSMKVNYWFYIEDVAEVICPRTYNSYDSTEVDEFVNDFRITACTSLIQWVISMVDSDKTVFSEHGTIPMKVMTFALNRCEEYLFEKRNRDIDHPIKTVSRKQWDAFLKKYYRLITSSDVFEADRDNKLPKYLTYAQILLQKLEKYRPQLYCEGYRNIWIIKPAHCSRGRGIRMASKLGVITDLLSKANTNYVVQKYIEKPLLIHETKFDIRQYYLVTNTYPLVIWMYRDCYLKFSSQKYNLGSYHESIHLTNNAVQRKYNNCADRHSELPISNMWELDTYKNYLNKIGENEVWEQIIYPGMKKSIIGIMLSCQDSLPFCKNRFELYGCDFLLDEMYTPWLIEINSCPDLTGTTEVTAKICPAVIDDIIKVVLDYNSNSSASTGKFECIYQQPMTIPKFSSSIEFLINGTPLPNDYFYKGTLTTNQYDNIADSSDENDNELLLNTFTSINSEDTMSDGLTLYSNYMDLPQPNLTLNEKDNAIGVKCKILDATTSKLEKKQGKKSSLKKIQLNNFQSNSSLITIKTLLNEFVDRVSIGCNKNVQVQCISKNINTKEMGKLIKKHVKSSLKPQIRIKLHKKPTDYILQAAPKIMSFINAKEIMYCTNLQ